MFLIAGFAIAKKKSRLSRPLMGPPFLRTATPNERIFASEVRQIDYLSLPRPWLRAPHFHHNSGDVRPFRSLLQILIRF